MIPASFASMILKFVLPEVREILVPLFKYKDEPNDADIRIDKLEAQMEMLAKDQHPPVIDIDEWEDVKATIKKIKNKKVFKSLNAK